MRSPRKTVVIRCEFCGVVFMAHRITRPGEVVHHKDENKQNYDPSNLVVYASQAEHVRLGHGGQGKS